MLNELTLFFELFEMVSNQGAEGQKRKEAFAKNKTCFAPQRLRSFAPLLPVVFHIKISDSILP